MVTRFLGGRGAQNGDARLQREAVAAIRQHRLRFRGAAELVQRPCDADKAGGMAGPHGVPAPECFLPSPAAPR